jgi:hypothetical protein
VAASVAGLQPAEVTAALANWSTKGWASPAPPGYPGAQNTSVAAAAIKSALMAIGYHYAALRHHLTDLKGALP